MKSPDLLAQLSGGDRRSTGRTGHVVSVIAKNRRLFPKLIAGLWSDDPIVRMRAADAVEKITRTHPKLLAPYKDALLGLLVEAQQPELRWHLAILVPRSALSKSQRLHAFAILQTYLQDRSSIVKTCALQGMWYLSQQDAALRSVVAETLQLAARSGTPAMQARSRNLLKLAR